MQPQIFNHTAQHKNWRFATCKSVVLAKNSCHDSQELAVLINLSKGPQKRAPYLIKLITTVGTNIMQSTVKDLLHCPKTEQLEKDVTWMYIYIYIYTDTHTHIYQ